MGTERREYREWSSIERLHRQDRNRAIHFGRLLNLEWVLMPRIHHGDVSIATGKQDTAGMTWFHDPMTTMDVSIRVGDLIRNLGVDTARVRLHDRLSDPSRQ